MITDASGAVVPSANITISDRTRGLTLQIHTSSTGAYTASTLLPGEYEVQVQAPGFRTAIVQVTVEVGRTITVDVPLQVGSREETVQVKAHAVQVNASQSSLEGVVTQTLINSLPLNGRNFLDLGQLEPGVQVVPDSIITRGAFTRLSVGSQTGLTTRVTVDGLEINDEHAGSVAMNVSAEAIQEFQISRSLFDISTGLTGSGAVNIVTKSGSNELHGGGFLFWRDATLAARVARQPTPFDREQAGFSLGGPFRRDRLFWFVNYERNNQDAAVVTTIPQFPQFSGTWASPFDERMAMGRLDSNIRSDLRAFFRFTHGSNGGITGSSLGGTKLTPLQATTNTNQTAFGLEIGSGRLVHSIRVGYTNNDFWTDIALEKVPGLPSTLDPKGRVVTWQQQGGGITLGGHMNALSARSQDTHEVRYDGGLSLGGHALRWGGVLNVIRVNWFETLNGRAPQVTFRSTDACGSELLCNPLVNVTISNGLGYFTEVPSLGRPHGGAGEHRVHWYVGDSWRAHPRVVLNFGLRWVYEAGPTNSDLQRPPVLDSFLAGLSTADRRNWNNFAPQLGVAWTPAASGRWVLRAGTGVFYDLNRLQNVMFTERSNLLPVGITGDSPSMTWRDPNTSCVIFDLQGRTNLSQPAGCRSPLVTPGVNWVGRRLNTPGLLDAVFAAQDAFRAAYQVAYANFPSGPSNCELSRVCYSIASDYQTPYALQFNFGAQRELRPGLMLSADYVRTRSLHFMMRYNANRTGAADTLNVASALKAMNAVQIPLGCDAGAAGVQCAIGRGGTLSTYVKAGLGSSATASMSAPSNSAFPGMNSSFNAVTLLTMSGFSNYSALQVNLRGRLPNLGVMAKNPTVVVSYALSRLEGTAEDQAIVNTGERVENDNPAGFRGPTSLDRTHMLSLAALFTVPGGVQVNSLWKAFSPLAQTVFVPQVAGAGAEIFYTDFDGDGTGQDVLPGTNRGSYGRGIGCGGAALNRVISAYNSTQRSNLTPAGQALVNAGLFTSDQLKQLAAVSPEVKAAPAEQVCLDSFITTDVRISRPFKFRRERLTIEPALEFFNLFNVANFDLPDNKLSGFLNASLGSVNGTTGVVRPNRAGGTGNFVLGSPRSWQLALRVTF